MGVISKFKNLIGLEDYDDELDEYEEEEYEQPVYRDRSAISSSSSSTTGSLSGRYNTANVISMQDRRIKAITNAYKLVVIEPQGFDDCSGQVDSLKNRKPIIVNLEKL